MKSLARMYIWQKLALLGLVFAVMFTVPTATMFYQAWGSLQRSTQELQGAERALATMGLMQAVSDHRAFSAGLLGGDASLQARREAARAQVDEKLKAAAEALAPQSPAATRLAAIGEAWKGLATAVAQKHVSSTESQYRHGELAAMIAALLEGILDDDGLAVDPDMQLHYTAEAGFVHAPALAETLGQVQSHGVTLLAARSGAQEDRVGISAALERVKERVSALRTSATKAGEGDAELQKRLAAALGEAEAQSTAAVRTARIEVVFSQALDASPAAHAAAQSRAIDAQYRFAAAAAAEVRQMLEARSTSGRLRIGVALALSIAAFALALAFGIWTGRSIARPLGHAVKVADGIAAGHLDHPIDPMRAKNREAARLMAAFDSMQAGLSGLARDIQSASREIHRASGQVAQGNGELSARTENQASSLEQTAATMEQLTAAVRNNAQSANKAVGVVNAATESAMRGSDAVDGVVATMDTINQASKRIADIISVIDGIAFQTNILALNAAVEAARAGEQGRGFAVVAAEVRSLAQRSTQAAKEIKGLIQASVDAAALGSSRVDEAGRAMDAIMDSVQRVSAIFGEVATASAEQGHGIEQVNRAVTEMDRNTQENAALVGEAAAASQSLQDQAVRLAELVARFHLGEGQGARGKGQELRGKEQGARGKAIESAVVPRLVAAE